MSARTIRNGFGDQCYGKAKHTAHTYAGEETENREVELRAAEIAQAGKGGVDQDRQRQHAGAAIFVSQSAEDQAANTPADEEASSDHFAKGLQIGVRRRQLHQFHQGWYSCEGKQPLVEAVKEPCCGGNNQHKPVVASELLVPRRVGIGNRRGAHEARMLNDMEGNDNPEITRILPQLAHQFFHQDRHSCEEVR